MRGGKPPCAGDMATYAHNRSLVSVSESAFDPKRTVVNLITLKSQVQIVPAPCVRSSSASFARLKRPACGRFESGIESAGSIRLYSAGQRSRPAESRNPGDRRIAKDRFRRSWRGLPGPAARIANRFPWPMSSPGRRGIPNRQGRGEPGRQTGRPRPAPARSGAAAGIGIATRTGSARKRAKRVAPARVRFIFTETKRLEGQKSL